MLRSAAPRSPDDSKGVIMFYCGPDNDKDLIKQRYGKNLLKCIPFTNPEFGFMHYKTDEQIKGGSYATRQGKNHAYKLMLPRSSEDSKGADSGPSRSPGSSTSGQV